MCLDKSIRAEGAWSEVRKVGALLRKNRAVWLVEDEPGGLTGHVPFRGVCLFPEQWEAVGLLQAGS